MVCTSGALATIAENLGIDSELHRVVLDRIKRIARDGSASNHHGMLKRAGKILGIMLQHLEDEGDDGLVASAMPAYVNRHHARWALMCC